MVPGPKVAGARIGALAEPGQILVSKTVVDLVVGSGIRFADSGEHYLKGVPGTWQLLAVAGQSDAERPRAEPAQKYMTSADRLTVRLARRAPRVMQALTRMAQR